LTVADNGEYNDFVYEGHVHRVWRERRDSGSVVLKRTFRGDATATNASLLKEFHFGIRLAGEHVCAAIDLLTADDRWTLVLEDFGGTDLQSLMLEAALGVAEAVDVAICWAQGLASVHLAGVIHKDVKPSNVVWNRRTGVVKVIDFGLASEQAVEVVDPVAGRRLQGTLDYISPEQTGRTGRGVDVRSDFYSFGASLYHLFTGQPPFVSADRLEMMHAHLARIPVAPVQLNPLVGESLSAIIMKLLAKDPAGRYQTDEGVIADLVEVRERLRSGRGGDFVAGLRDVSQVLRLPTTLVGRQRELSALSLALDRACGGQGPRAMWLSGEAGVGKSALIEAARAGVVAGGARFGGGKYDQVQTNVPYSGLVEACREMLRELLISPAAQRRDLGERLRAAVPSGLEVLVPLLPEIEKFVGAQAEIVELGPVESKARFTNVFVAFISALGTAERPIVLFVDDLQWADVASISVLEAMIGQDGISGFAIIGAYRPSAVGQSHPAGAILRDSVVGGTATAIAVEPLGAGDIEVFLSEALGTAPAAVAGLADYVVTHTSGNAFYMRELLEALNRQGLITRGRAGAGWRWDLDEIAAAGLTDNAGALVAGRINGYPDETRAALAVAACAGNTFDVAVLAGAIGVDEVELMGRLGPALDDRVLRESLATAVDDTGRAVRFVHDRVQEAALGYLSEPERARAHVLVGRRMRALGMADHDVLAVMTHLNYGLGEGLRDEIDDGREIASLNIQAGRRARAAGAIASALELFEAAREWCGPDRWSADYSMALAMAEQLAALYLWNGDIEAAQAMIDEGLAHARTDYDRALLMEHSMVLRLRFFDLPGASTRALDALRLLGWEIPEDFARAVQTEAAALLDDLAGWDASRILALAANDDAEVHLANRVCAAASMAASMEEIWRAAFIILRGVRLMIRHGLTPEGVKILAVARVGLWVATAGDLESVRLVQDMAMVLWERGPVLSDMFGPGVLATFLTHYLLDSDDHRLLLQRAEQHARLTGDIPAEAALRSVRPALGLLAGEPLTGLREEAATAQAFSGRVRNGMAFFFAGVVWMHTAALAGTGERDRDAVAVPTPDALLALANLAPAGTLRSYVHSFVMRQAYLLRDLPRAVAALHETKPDPLGHILAADHEFYQALVLLADLDNSPDRQATLSEVRLLRDRLAAFALRCPSTFGPRRDLVDVAIDSAESPGLGMIERYDQAISDAEEYGLNQVVAIGCELAARLLAARASQKSALGYVVHAREAYRRWEAFAKVDQLNAEFGLLTRSPAIAAATTGASTSLFSGSTYAGEDTGMDLLALLRASLAISKRLSLPELCQEILKLSVQDAGAEAGVLVHDDLDFIGIAAADGSIELVPLEGRELGDVARFVITPVIEAVYRSGEPILIDDANLDSRCKPAVAAGGRGAKSVLCVPLLRADKACGALYLDNSLVAAAFGAQSVEVAQVICAQAVVSVENARLYGELAELNESLEARVERRTAQLAASNERLRQEAAVREAMREKLVVREKLAGLGTFTAGVAHHIRNPLNFISNFADVIDQCSMDIIDSAPDFEGLEENVGILADAAKRVVANSKRIGDLVAKMERHIERSNLPSAPIDIMDVVEKAARDVLDALGEAKPGLQVRSPGAVTAVADPEQLARVVSIIVWNACEATAGASHDGCIEIELSSSGADAVLTVSDNGTGMTGETLDHVFDPFFTTKMGASGTGLGLAVAYDIVVGIHGGTISVESEPGVGTTFTVTIPRRPIATEGIEELEPRSDGVG
jgi:predicted ATPase/signal transduction histidine kinase